MPLLESGSIDSVITSPPYWGMCDYDVDGQLGLEPTPEEYIRNLVSVFRLVWEVLKDDGTLWINIGDVYAGNKGGGGMSNNYAGKFRLACTSARKNRRVPFGYKAGDLISLSSDLANALRADGWYLRSKIVWHKKNPTTESVKSRPIKSHEFVLFLTKSMKYEYDFEGSREPAKTREGTFRSPHNVWEFAGKRADTIHPCPYPPELVERCLIGCPIGGTILDPFSGRGTTGIVALENNRRFVGIELNPAFNREAYENLSRIPNEKTRLVSRAGFGLA